MKQFLVLVVVCAAVLNPEVQAGPIWDRARRMFGWDKPEEQGSNVPVSPHYSQGGGGGGGGGPQGYAPGGPSQKGPPSYGPSGPPGGGPYQASGGPYRPLSYGRPDLQHAASALFGSFASPSFAGPSYAKAPHAGAFGGGYPLQGAAGPATGGFGGVYGASDYAAPSASNNYGGLFSVVDQTSQIGQLANGDLAASPSEPYATSNEDVMKSLLKMVDKPFDLETAASGSQYFGQPPQLTFSPGPHPIMEADRNVIRYRTSPIQIGVSDHSYGQHQVSSHSGLGSSVGQSLGSSVGSFGTSPFSSSALSSSYGSDLHAAASSSKKTLSHAQKSQ